MINIQTTLMATSIDIDAIIEPILSIFNTALLPIVIAIVAVIGIPTIISKIIKLSKAEDENQIAAAKKTLINSIISIVGIFLFLLIFNLAMPELQAWLGDLDFTTVTAGTN